MLRCSVFFPTPTTLFGAADRPARVLFHGAQNELLLLQYSWRGIPAFHDRPHFPNHGAFRFLSSAPRLETLLAAAYFPLKD